MILKVPNLKKVKVKKVKISPNFYCFCVSSINLCIDIFSSFFKNLRILLYYFIIFKTSIKDISFHIISEEQQKVNKLTTTVRDSMQLPLSKENDSNEELRRLGVQQENSQKTRKIVITAKLFQNNTCIFSF